MILDNLKKLWKKEKILIWITFVIFIWVWFFLTSIFTTKQEIPKEEVVKTEEKKEVKKVASLVEDKDWNVNVLFVWLPSTPENKNNLIVLTKINRKNNQLSIIDIDNRITYNWVWLLKMDRESLFSSIKWLFDIENLYTVELDDKTLEDYITASNWNFTLWKKTFNNSSILEQSMTQFIWENWRQQQVLQSRFVVAMLWQLEVKWKLDLFMTSTKNNFKTSEARELFNTFSSWKKWVKIVPYIFSISDRPWRIEQLWKNFVFSQSWLNELKSIK